LGDLLGVKFVSILFSVYIIQNIFVDMSRKVTMSSSMTNRPTCGGPRKAGLAPRGTNFMMSVKRNHRFSGKPFAGKAADYPMSCRGSGGGGNGLTLGGGLPPTGTYKVRTTLKKEKEGEQVNKATYFFEYRDTATGEEKYAHFMTVVAADSTRDSWGNTTRVLEIKDNLPENTKAYHSGGEEIKQWDIVGWEDKEYGKILKNIKLIPGEPSGNWPQLDDLTHWVSDLLPVNKIEIVTTHICSKVNQGQQKAMEGHDVCTHDYACKGPTGDAPAAGCSRTDSEKCDKAIGRSSTLLNCGCCPRNGAVSDHPNAKENHADGNFIFDSSGKSGRCQKPGADTSKDYREMGIVTCGDSATGKGVGRDYKCVCEAGPNGWEKAPWPT
jgi:hypothetical protein